MRTIKKIHKAEYRPIADLVTYSPMPTRVQQNDNSVVFYDVTTLYFEIDQKDELRKTGFSKEGKPQNPQIVLGLLISKHG